MQTIMTDSPEEAARFLNGGAIVAFPTETVYGLGADVFNPAAIDRIFEAKGRPSDNPLIVHVSTPEEVAVVAGEVNEHASLLIGRFFPGPLTVVVHKSRAIPDKVTAGLPTVGIRCPSHPTAREFLHCCSNPVAAPSANISGRPSSTDWTTVAHDLDGRIGCILRGNPSRIGLESTIVDCSVEPPLLLRSGAVSIESLREVIPDLGLATSCMPGEIPKSPGMKYRHYSPEAMILLVDTPPLAVPLKPPAAYIGLSDPPEGARPCRQCRSLEEYGRELFAFFRSCDALGTSIIYCQMPPDRGIGRAIRDRLEKAAGRR